jgi:uncharacterized protein (DUF433 family)
VADIFVSYTSSDRDWAFWIGQELLKLGHDYQHIITIDPGGRPCVRHMRIAVADVLGWLAAGQSHAQILDDFPELKGDDIRACLAYAADRERRSIIAST